MYNNEEIFTEAVRSIKRIVDVDLKTEIQEMETSINKVIYELVYAIKIDWREMKEKIENWEKTYKIPLSSYEEIFLNYWLDQIPRGTRDILFEIMEENKRHHSIFQDSISSKILKEIKLLGASIYQIRNTNFCASTITPLIPCEKCYFVGVCKIKS